MFVLPHRMSHRLLESIQQQPTVGQSGKLVVVGEFADLRFPSRKLGQFPLQQRIALRQALDALEAACVCCRLSVSARMTSASSESAHRKCEA